MWNAMQTLLAHYTLTWQFTHTEHQFEAIYGRCSIALEGTPPIIVMFVLPTGALLAAQR